MDQAEAIQTLVERLYKNDDPDVLEALGVLSRVQRLRNNLQRVVATNALSGKDNARFDGHNELLSECAEHVTAYQRVLWIRGLVLKSVEISGAMPGVERNISYMPPEGDFSVELKP